MKKTHGFTLLEVIIVIIIVGVLASLSLPKLFSVIEGSRAAEALVHIASLRRAVERYYLMNGTYKSSTDILYCDFHGADPLLPDADQLGIGVSLSDSPNAHFAYVVYSRSNLGYAILAIRLLKDGAIIKAEPDAIFFGIGYEFVSVGTGIQPIPEHSKVIWDGTKIYKPFIPKTD